MQTASVQRNTINQDVQQQLSTVKKKEYRESGRKCSRKKTMEELNEQGRNPMQPPDRERAYLLRYGDLLMVQRLVELGACALCRGGCRRVFGVLLEKKEDSTHVGDMLVPEMVLHVGDIWCVSCMWVIAGFVDCLDTTVARSQKTPTHVTIYIHSAVIDFCVPFPLTVSKVRHMQNFSHSGVVDTCRQVHVRVCRKPGTFRNPAYSTPSSVVKSPAS